LSSALVWRLVTTTQLAQGAKVLVLERYVIPGGSAGYFEREGYRFDVGASMIFGFGTQGTTNLPGALML